MVSADASVSQRVWAADPDAGQVVTFTLSVPPPAGTAVVQPDGNYTFIPPPNSAASFRFRVSACDDYVVPACDEVGVTAVIYPVAHPDVATTTDGVPVTFSLTANDRGGVGAPTLVGPGPASGTVTVAAVGDATYSPNAGFTGQDSFQYEVCAAAAPTLCATGTATITVGPAPPPPVSVQPLALVTDATFPVTGDLTYNYPPDELQFDVTTAAGNGTGTVDATGRVTYAPNGSFTGRDQFSVDACLSTDPANCGSGVVSVTVFPDATNDSATLETSTSVDIAVTANDVGSSGPPQELSAPANGTATVVATAVRYTPEAGFVGTDSFTYTICSTVDTDVCDTATVDVAVTAPPNLPPTAQDANVTGPADAPVSGQVLVSDPDADQQLTVTLLTAPTSGTAVVDPDGSFTFTPPVNTADVFTFEVQVCDDGTGELCDTATVTVTVTPVAHPDAAATSAGVPVTFPLTANDRGGVGAPVVTSDPANGTVVIQADGQATYTPDAGFVGDDSFRYQVCATAEPALCVTGAANVHVDPEPLPPVQVQPADLTTSATFPVVADLTYNHPAADLVFTVSSPATHGTGTVDATGRVTYTPTGLFTGRDQFTVQACSTPEPGNCGTAVVTVTVLPVAQDDTATVEVDGDVDIPVEANDLGTVGPIADLTQPAHGTAQVTASVLYTPDAGFVGTDSFTYTICSTLDVDVCATAVVTVAVLPVATGDVLATEAGAAGVEDVLANDTVGPDPVTTLVSGPANGTATLAGGVLTYTPTDEFTGHDQLIYQVCAPDGPPSCAQALVLVEVSPDVNPVLATTPQSTAIAIDVTANDFGDAGTPVVTRPPVHGTVTGGGLDLVRAIVGTGNVDLSAVAPLVYTPHPGYVGADTFLYTRCAESTTLCSETAVVVLVLPVEEPPTTTPPPSVPGAQDPGAGGGSGALSATGAAAAQLAALAVALLGAGVVLVGVNGRRQHRS